MKFAHGDKNLYVCSAETSRADSTGTNRGSAGRHQGAVFAEGEMGIRGDREILLPCISLIPMIPPSPLSISRRQIRPRFLRSTFGQERVGHETRRTTDGTEATDVRRRNPSRECGESAFR